VELHIYGGPPEVGESVDVVAMVGALPNRESVKIHGQVQDISRALAQCHAVLVPSVNPDPLPTIAIEASGAGRAVIASDCGGLPEIVSDGTTGWLVRPDSVDDWKDLLSKLSGSDITSAGANARARYETHFDKVRFSADIEAIIDAQL
jgi:glycosyltransferase involved in cell wall biosynthesis